MTHDSSQHVAISCERDLQPTDVGSKLGGEGFSSRPVLQGVKTLPYEGLDTHTLVQQQTRSSGGQNLARKSALDFSSSFSSRPVLQGVETRVFALHLLQRGFSSRPVLQGVKTEWRIC